MNLDYCRQQLQHLAKQKRIFDMDSYLTKEDHALIMKQAKELMDNTFTFDKPWDMERCITPYHFEEIDWNAQRNEDEEWCFMLNRMDYLNYLILAGLISKEDEYLLKGKALILNWIKQHPVIQSEPSTRTLDTGIRIMNMMETLPYIYSTHLLEEDELALIMQSIDDQIHYLKDQYLKKYTLSNWGSIQTCAILSILPLYKEHYVSDPIYQWAYEELSTQFQIQVYDDGMQWEQSTMYHIEVLNYGMKALYYQSIYGIPVHPILSKQVYALADALFYQVTPAYEIETFGDSDRANVQDVFTRAATLFSQPQWKTAGYPRFDLESLYTFGCEYADSYQRLKQQIPSSNVYDGIDSGMYVIRSSWESDASFTMFTNGSLGSGHGHSDNQHISIYHKGIPILIDPGRYTYREDHPMRVELKSMHAHNGVIVDGKEYCLPSDSWGYHDFGIPCKTYVRHIQNLHYIEGIMLGHDPLQVWIRKVVVIDPGIWMVMDEIKEDGNHTMKTVFHCDPMIHAAQKNDHVQLGSLSMTGEVPAIVEKGRCSLRYNELSDHDIVCYTKDFLDEATQCICIADQKISIEEALIYQNGTIPMSNDMVSARKFVLSDKESYTVAVFHKEIFKGKKICECEGMPFHAKCIVVHEINGKKELIRLRA